MTTKLQNANIDSNAVVSANITDSTLVNADFNASAALDISKFSGLAAEADGDRIYYNIALLGFKQAVSNSLNIFNLVNGIVDEFQDTSGVASSSFNSRGVPFCARCWISDCNSNRLVTPSPSVVFPRFRRRWNS